MMIRFTLSLSVFATALFLFTASVSAQGFGLVQNDYDRYATLFKEGREPNLSHHPTEGSANWRKLYRDHNWKGYAERTEHRDPMHAAQVLMAIYLTQYIDHELTYQIDSIIRYNAHFSNALAEYITLSRIDAYFSSRLARNPSGNSGEAARQSRDNASPSRSIYDLIDEFTAPRTRAGMTFYSQDEIERMDRLGIDLDVTARKRMVSGAAITPRQQSEFRSVQNLFHQDTEDWASTYYYLREKFLVLDSLRDEFSYNWTAERRAVKLNEHKKSDVVKRQAQQIVNAQVEQDKLDAAFAARLARARAADERAREILVGALARGISAGDRSDQHGTAEGVNLYDGEYSQEPESRPMTDEEIEMMTLDMIEQIAERRLQQLESRHKAFRYITGVYQSTGHHMETLRKIHRYHRQTANQGNPIAQYHYALFLRYLGEFLDLDQAEAENMSQELLHKAAMSDVAKDRVKELYAYFDLEGREEAKRNATREKRVETLVKVEEEKMEMLEEVLERILQRIGDNRSRSDRTGSGNDQ